MIRNPRYRHERLRSPAKLYHYRTVKAGKHRVIIGCPVKHAGPCPVPTVAQAILHPKKENPISVRRKQSLPLTKIYQRVGRITAQKGPGHRCDADCKKANHWYYHDFKTGPRMYGLADGSLLIRR